MNLARFALPLTLSLAVGSTVPPAVSPAPPAVPPPASLSKPAAPPPAQSSKPAAPPLLALKPAPAVPGRAHTFVVPSPQGGQTVITIPRCYLVPNMQSLVVPMQVASLGQPPPLLVVPPAPLPSLPAVPRSLPSLPTFRQPAPPASGDTSYKGAHIMVGSMTHIPPCRFVYDFRPGLARVYSAEDAKRQRDLFKPRPALPNAATPPAPR